MLTLSATMALPETFYTAASPLHAQNSFPCEIHIQGTFDPGFSYYLVWDRDQDNVFDLDENPEYCVYNISEPANYQGDAILTAAIDPAGGICDDNGDGDRAFLVAEVNGSGHARTVCSATIHYSGAPVVCEVKEFNRLRQDLGFNFDGSVRIGMIPTADYPDAVQGSGTAIWEEGDGNQTFYFDYDPGLGVDSIIRDGQVDPWPFSEFIHTPTLITGSGYWITHFAQGSGYDLAAVPTHDSQATPTPAFGALAPYNTQVTPYVAYDPQQISCCGGSPADGPWEPLPLPGPGGGGGQLPGGGGGQLPGGGPGNSGGAAGGVGGTGITIGSGNGPSGVTVGISFADIGGSNPYGSVRVSSFVALDSDNFNQTAPVYYATEQQNSILGFSVSAPLNTAGLPAGHYVYTVEIVGKRTEHDVFADNCMALQCGSFDIAPTVNSPFGYGSWYNDLDSLTATNNGLLLYTSDGRTIWFGGDDRLGYLSPAGTERALYIISGDTTNPHYKTASDYYEVNNADGSVTIFDHGGNLLRREDLAGNIERSYEYATIDGAPYLSAVYDGSGRDDVLGRKMAAFTYGKKSFDASGDETGPSGGDTVLLISVTDEEGITRTVTHHRQTVAGETRYNIAEIALPDPDGAGAETAPVWILGYNTDRGQVVSLEMPNGKAITYGYDSSGNLQQIAYPDGTTDQLDDVSSFGSWSAVSGGGSESDPYILSASTAPYARRTDPLGHTTAFVWGSDENGRYRQATDPTGQVSRDYWSDTGQLIRKVVDPDGARPMAERVTTYEYASGYVPREYTSVTSADGIAESWTYDSLGRLKDYGDKNGVHTVYAYSDGGSLHCTVKTTTVAGQETSVEYLSSADSTSFVYPAGDSATYDYSQLPVGTVLVSFDGAQRETNHYYDLRSSGGQRALSFGKLTKTVTACGEPEEAIVRYIYTDAAGQPTAVLMAEIDELGRRTDYCYDALNRLTKTQGPYRVDGNGEALRYDWIENDVSTNGFGTAYTDGGYDGDYFRVAPATPASATAEWNFTDLTPEHHYEVLATWVPNSQNATNATYSVGGNSYTVNQRLTPAHAVLGSRWQSLGVVTAGGTSLLVSLDNNANGPVVADAVRVVEVPDGETVEYRGETGYEYDQLGNQTATIDAMGRRTETVYDALGGRPIQVIGVDPDGDGPQSAPVTVFGYDQARNTAYTVEPSGRLTTHAYDANNRETAEYRGLLVDNPANATSWTPVADGYGGSCLATTTTGASVSWKFDNLVPGRTYEIAVSWIADDDNTLSATYSVVGGTLQGDLEIIDQQTTPTHPLLARGWHKLGDYAVTGTSLTVTLTNDDSRRVVADAVVVYDVAPTSQCTYDGFGNIATSTDALGNVMYHAYDVLHRSLADFTKTAALSDGSATYTGTPWTTITPEGSSDTYRVHGTILGATPSATARWSTPGTLKKHAVYEVLVSWQMYYVSGSLKNSAKAPFAVYQDSTLLSRFAVDQSKTPDAEGRFYWIDGRCYRSLGRYSVSADNAALTVELGNNSDESGLYVVADEVCIVDVSSSSRTIYDAAGQSLASIDPLGRISATRYDNQGRQVNTYAGVFLDDTEPGFAYNGSEAHRTGSGFAGTKQATIGNTAYWTFNNLSFAADAPFDLYVYHPYAQPDPQKYAVIYPNYNPVDFAADASASDASLIEGWYKVGTIGAFSGTTLIVTLEGDYYDVYADAVCLLQQTSQTIYDQAGNTVATIDALGQVTLPVYDAQYRQTAMQQGTIIDDSDPAGFDTEGGGWNTWSGSSAYKGKYLSSNEPGANATWTFGNLAPSNGGHYDLYVSRAVTAGASYELWDDSDTCFATLTDDSTDAAPLGASWYKLGTVSYSGKELTVKLTDASYGADAVCLVQTLSTTVYDAAGQATAAIDALGRVSAPVYDYLGRAIGLQQGFAVDDGEAAFSTSGGSWTPTSAASAYQGACLVSSTEGSTATWKFEHLIPGRKYAVNLSWIAGTGNTPDAQYTVTGGTIEGTAQTIDQRSTPTHPALGTGWQQLAVYTAGETGTITVTLAYDGTGSVVADAACLLDVTPSLAPTFDANGNVLAAYDAQDNQTSFQYDHAGRLLKTIGPDADGLTSTTSDILLSQTLCNAAGETTAEIAAYGQTAANSTKYLYRTVTGHDFDSLGREIDVKKGVLMDNKDAGLTLWGGTNWTTVTSDWGYDGQYLSAAGVSGTATARATWTFGNLIAGRQYEVVVSWVADTANTGNAPYSVSGGTLVGTAQTIDQRTTSTHPILGTGWQRRGIYQVDSGGSSLSVMLTNSNGATGNVVADAVCLVEVTPAASATFDAAGRVLTSTDAMGRTTTNEFDQLGRLVKVTAPDADGNSGTTTDIGITRYVYNAAGQMIEFYQGASGGTADLVSAYRYDYLGRRTAVLSPDPTTGAASEDRMQRSEYDLLGRLRYQYDALGNQTEFVYDAFGRLTDKYDPDPDGNPTSGLDRPHTAYTYNAAGERLNLTDPTANTTNWTYDYLGRMVEEKVYEAPNDAYTRKFEYNMVGDLTKKTDRENRETVYAFDNLHRQTSEAWMSGGSATRTMTYTLDTFGRMLSITDRAGSTPVGADYTYTYDWYGNNTSIASTIAGLTPTVNFTQQFDMAGNRLQLNAKLGTAQLFQNQYRYDRLGRMTQVSQGYQSGGGQSSMLSFLMEEGTGADAESGEEGEEDALLAIEGMSPMAGGSPLYPADKHADFGYDAYGRMSTIHRFAGFSGSTLVANTNNTFDRASRLTALTHFYNATGQSYSWTYDDADQVSTFTSPDGDGTYTYDHDGQLTADAYTYQDDKSYSYDENGNRTPAPGTSLPPYQTGVQNRITRDADSYYYLYDYEGNRQFKFLSSDGQLGSNATNITKYIWDYRNRLASVEQYTNYSAYTSQSPNKVISYSYDAFDRRVGKTVDNPPLGSINSREVYVYDGQNPVLQFQANQSGDLGTTTPRHFYLYGPAVDQILADDVGTASGGSSGYGASINWMLSDNEGTVRDVVTRNMSSTVLVDHLKYDAFGNITTQTAPSQQPHFTYTGRELDADTGLYYYRARWYDAKTGKFVSQDPMSFEAGDENLYRYVGNGPTNATDPSGLWKIDESEKGKWTRHYKNGKESFTGCIVAESDEDTFDEAMRLMIGPGKRYPRPNDWKGRIKKGNSYSVGNILQTFNMELRENVKAAAERFHAPFTLGGEWNAPSIMYLICQEFTDFAFPIACGGAVWTCGIRGLVDTMRDGMYVFHLREIPANYQTVFSFFSAHTASRTDEKQFKGDFGNFKNRDKDYKGVDGWQAEWVIVIEPDKKYFAHSSQKKKIFSKKELVDYMLRQNFGRGPVEWAEETHRFWDVIKIETEAFDYRKGNK